MVEFNINEYVSVQLNDHGRKVHRKQYDALCEFYGRQPYAYRPPVEDSGGWSKWQLWDLMSTFGEAVQMGCELPFDTTTIRIHTKNDPKEPS